VSVAVIFKWAYSPADAQVRSDGTLDLSRAKAAISEYDPVAIAAGRQLANDLGTDLVGLTAGPAGIDSPLMRKAALSRGLDRLFVATHSALEQANSTVTANVLAAALGREPEIAAVIAGAESVDDAAGQVPLTLAGLLDWPGLAGVSGIAVDGGALEVYRTGANRQETLRLTGPAVLAVTTNAVSPPVPGMKDILAAGKKPATVLDEAELGPVTCAQAVEVGRRPTAVPRREGRVLDGELAEAVRQAVSVIQEAGLA
jgi:electron transfer flavoprotein beta subunit